ncbi:MAG: zf-HC2 domain-containing protein [Acutalibacteraceae bacterium]|nr:zf-HC2 domain-containing protein [Acutalibacteraceae bacterium]
MTHADDKRIMLLLRGELSESEAAEVMEHIAKCDECADRMADLTLDMACVDPPAGMNEDILAAAAKENTREKRRQDNLLMYSVRVVAGICAALVMIFSGAFRHITKINDIDMSKINDKSRSISQSIDESFNEFKQKISDLGGNNNEQKE